MRSTFQRNRPCSSRLVERVDLLCRNRSGLRLRRSWGGPVPKKLTRFAIAYDFDGTLAPGNMQEHGFIPTIGMSKKAFWKRVGEEAEKHNADNILVYMGLMLSEARARRVPV